jgi:hypothetical protein
MKWVFISQETAFFILAAVKTSTLIYVLVVEDALVRTLLADNQGLRHEIGCLVDGYDSAGSVALSKTKEHVRGNVGQLRVLAHPLKTIVQAVGKVTNVRLDQAPVHLPEN